MGEQVLARETPCQAFGGEQTVGRIGLAPEFLFKMIVRAFPLIGLIAALKFLF